MKSFRVTGRGTLGRAGRLQATLGAAPALALAATLLVSALGPPTPVGMAAQPAEPMARLQVVVKQVLIHDDREGRFSGQGEMYLYAGIWGCNEGIPPPCFAPEFEPQGPLEPRGAETVSAHLPGSIAGTARPIARATMSTPVRETP